MSSPSADAVKTEIDQSKMKVGNIITATTGLPTTASALPYVDSASKLAATAVTASKPVYINSSSIPQTGAIPFSVPVSLGTSTTATFLNVTGYSTASADTMMTFPLVAGGNVTTFTKTGFIKVTVTDTAGNLTDGDHYIQIGTLS
jgi:hypothetical protein